MHQASGRDRKEVSRSERALAAISSVNRALVRAEDEKTLLKDICRILVKDCGYRFAWIGYAEQDASRTITPVAKFGYERGYLATLHLTWSDSPRGRGPGGLAIRTGKPAVTRNIRADSSFKPWRQEALARGYASAIALPLSGQSGPFGALIMYSREEDAFDEAEQEMLGQMADDLAYGITALRGREERLQLLTALGESEERYRHIMESTGTAICILDRAGKITFGNQEFHRIFAAGQAQADGSLPASLLDCIEPDDVGHFVRAMRVALDPRSSRTGSTECRLHDMRGNLLHFLISANRLPDSDELVVSLVDISWEKYYAQTLRDNAERLRDFMNIASHELRHPITIISGYASLLIDARSAIPEDRIPSIMRSIYAASRRLKNVVDQLLDISRIEQGRFSMSPEPTELEPLVEQAVEEMKVRGFSHSFRTDMRELSLAFADPERFVQLLVILLENACKFSPPGTPIRITARQDAESVTVSVLDRGSGIPREAREKVFERFYEVEGVDHHSLPGLGVGLSIAREIVRSHGGRIWCEARRGGGTAFRFTLQLAATSSRAARHR
ncbi:MAG: GAF domain-containing sensor histidine kinase [Candidatus Geothermincolia bacterium]